MLSVRLITVGTLKEKYFRDACGEYLKRLQAFCRAEVIEISESRLPEKPSDKETEAALANEAKAMDAYLNAKGAYNIAMCIEGKQMSSTALAETINKAGVDGFSSINFFIGSSYGLDETLKKQCRMRLSMSEMTFPHMLARVMLLEQVYRGFMINSGKKYHK